MFIKVKDDTDRVEMINVNYIKKFYANPNDTKKQTIIHFAEKGVSMLINESFNDFSNRIEKMLGD